MRCVRRDLCPGSPPRLWGAPILLAQALDLVRFTPTPVGSAESRMNTTEPIEVHPHACGERAGVVLVDARALGSPPRLWGARRHCW